MPMSKLRISWFVVVIALAIFLIVARYIWASELLHFENRIIQSLGFDPSIKYFFTVPVFLLLIYSYYRREARALSSAGRPVVRKWVISFAGIFLLLVFLYLQLYVRGSHT